MASSIKFEERAEPVESKTDDRDKVIVETTTVTQENRYTLRQKEEELTNLQAAVEKLESDINNIKTQLKVK